jgi:PAS domain S-box-containing protein
MNGVVSILTEEYTAAIREYLAGSDEVALRLAYEAGRRALAEGMGVLELVSAHQAPLIQALRTETTEHGKERMLIHALGCLAEGLSTFEMVLRGTQEGGERLQRSLSSLQSVEEQLRFQNEELTVAHRSVEKERRRYQTLFDFAPDGYLVTGLEGAIREANTAAATLLRTPQEMLPGQSLHEFVVEADRSEFRERLRNLHLRTVDRLEDWQIYIQPRSGPPIPVALTVVAERAVPAIAGLRWLIRDVTARRRLEKERARSLVGEARAEAARRFEFLAEASSRLVDSFDVEANLISVARLTVSFLAGWCFVGIIEPDGTFRQLEVAHGDPALTDLATGLRRHCLLRTQTNEENARQLLDPQVINPLTSEWLDQVADGREHAELLRQINGSSAMVLPLRIHDRLMGVMTLISPGGARGYRPADRLFGGDLARCCALALENARLYRDVVAERDKAEQASRAKDEFVAILAHELRNPLTPILGWIQTLKGHALISRDPALRAGVSSMERNGKMLARLAGDCVDLARISERKIQVEQKPTDLNAIILASVEAVREMATARGLRLTLDLAPEPVQVLGDTMRLEQVVMNLLINAVKYTERDGLISVRSTSSGEAEVEVQDTGIGIDPAFLDLIFQPFRQGTASWLTSQSGLGLGLTITRQIVEMHGGRVWAESQGLGRGSTFHVRLPLSTLTHEENHVGIPIAHPESQGSGIQLLLVEDSEDILFLMKDELERLGYAVTTARNGRVGIETAQAHRPDVIISDIKMPVMDGYELIRTIRATPELRNLSAIALTGFGTGSSERALAAGFDACLSKPPEREELLAVIQKLTERNSSAPAGPGFSLTAHSAKERPRDES